MKLTTLCYIERDGAWLMLHRVKKKQDANQGKWIGVGGKIEEGESPEECLVREVREETGLTLRSHRFRGIVTFVSDRWESEIMFLYTADDFAGCLSECCEGDLAFVPKEQVFALNLWEGDRIFLKLLIEDASFFNLKLSYEDERLVSALLEGKPMCGLYDAK